MNKYLSHIILIFALFAGLGEVYAQTAPEPGTEIPNIVSTTYTEADTNTDVEVYSNEVLVTVQDNPEFSFFPNESYKDFRGTQFEITHFVRNDGNTVADILVKGYNAAEDDDYDIQNLSWTNSQVYKTVANSDTITTQVELQPGQTLEISYSGEISVNEDRDTLTAVMIFEATDLRTGKTLYVYDDIGIKIGAIVDIQKEQTGDAVKTQGDTFTYRIMGENVGDMTALPRDIIIDGIESNQVILIDSVPNNLTFQQFGTFDKGFPLYHVVGAGEREFSSTLPDDLGSVDVIGVGFDSLQVGETFDINFDVRINDNATGDITNVAQLTYVDPEGTVTTVAASNLVAATLPEMGAGIDYYTNEDFEQKTSTSSIGELLHIQADASVCNENRSVIETVTIDLTSDLTGDMERFTGIETGPNTGVFRIPNEVPTRDGSENEVVPYNEILETVEDDIIIAQLGCNAINQGGPGGGGGPVEIFAQVAVDPYGIVFDSETNEVVEGAEVRIIDVTGANNGGNPGGPATVYTANGVGITDNIQISGVRGKYRFPFLLPGTYRLDVIAPEGYEFASDVPVDSLDPTRKVDLNASYGQEFEIVNNPAGLDFDIPLDPLALGVLFVNKTVDRKAAGVGDFVNYSIEIRSQAVNTVNDLILYDNLPFGFTYQTGTARLDGQSIADPTGGTGPALEFDLGSIDPGQTMTLTYRVYIGIGAERGDGVNTARVQSDGVIVRTSNDAKVKIEVTGGAFNDDAFIVGKVFLDCNEDNMQDASEPGIPGVRLYLENGNYVITDSEGKYTFYAIKPNKHVLKLDNYSLPEGSKLKVLDNRHAFDPSSRFVDVTKGEMHRADFAVCECSEATFAEIKRRADLLDGTQKSNLETSMSQSFSLQERSAVSSRGSYNQASGTAGSAKALELNATPGEKVEAVSETMIDTTVSESNPVEDIEQALMNADDGTDFLNIADGDTVKTDQITLLAKGTKGTVFDVFINDEVVSSDRIGQRSVLTNRKLQVWEFVSVSLQPGTNSIRLVETDPFGNIRGEKVIQVHTPGKLATLDMTVPRNNVSADGVSTAIVRIELLDENGINIGARLPVTLDVSFGTWKVEDVNEKEPGTQVFIEGGVAEFELQSTIEPNTSKVRAYVGEIYDEAKVEFLPDLRPMLAAGILEGTVRLRDPLNINQNVE
ncbi:MAG TPA: hypothetical protein DEQ34_11235, partial [Balneolaceae bacterium]|nr:hypothetical protein [Balneolaceae bacterium]